MLIPLQDTALCSNVPLTLTHKCVWSKKPNKRSGLYGKLSIRLTRKDIYVEVLKKNLQITSIGQAGCGRRVQKTPTSIRISDS